MKKIVLLLFVVCAAMTVNAQVYVGGSVGFWNDDDADFTNFTIAPEIGYNINSKWAIGAELAFMHQKEGDNKGNAFAIAPYARFSYYESGIVRLFLDGGFGYVTAKPKGGDSIDGFEVGLKPGIAIKLTDKFSLVGKFGFVGYRDDYGLDLDATSNGFGLGLSGADLRVGFLINF